jgi:hypothetical protein
MAAIYGCSLDVPAWTSEAAREGHRGYRPRLAILRTGPGEVRVPRETPQEALRIALERLADLVPRADLASVEKVAVLLLGALQQSGAAYARQFRPMR